MITSNICWQKEWLFPSTLGFMNLACFDINITGCNEQHCNLKLSTCFQSFRINISINITIITIIIIIIIIKQVQHTSSSPITETPPPMLLCHAKPDARQQWPYLWLETKLRTSNKRTYAKYHWNGIYNHWLVVVALELTLDNIYIYTSNLYLLRNRKLSHCSWTKSRISWYSTFFIPQPLQEWNVTTWVFLFLFPCRFRGILGHFGA